MLKIGSIYHKHSPMIIDRLSYRNLIFYGIREHQPIHKSLDFLTGLTYFIWRVGEACHLFIKVASTITPYTVGDSRLCQQIALITAIYEYVGHYYTIR